MDAIKKLDRSVKGRAVLVTGAASGMGRATAHVFAQEGALVAITDINEAGVARVVEEIAGEGGKAYGWVLDVMDHAAIKRVVASDFKDARVVPWMTTGGTDSRVIRDKGVPAYGFVPVILGEGELSRIHGDDERLSVDNLNRGIKATYYLTVDLCAAQK